jgi:hypothetical protein
MELGVFYEELLKRLPMFSLDPNKRCVYRGGQVLAVDSLPIIW